LLHSAISTSASARAIKGMTVNRIWDPKTRSRPTPKHNLGPQN